MSGHKSTVSIDSPRITNFQVNTSLYGRPITLLWGQNRVSPNLIWFGGFRAIPHTTTEESGGKGGGGGVKTVTTTYTYEAALIMALCAGAVTAALRMWRGKELTTASALGFTLFTGVSAQTPWGYLTTKYPLQAIGYEDIAALANQSYQLTSNAEVFNHTLEITGPLAYGLIAALAKTGSRSGNTISSTAHGFDNATWVIYTTSGTTIGGLTPSSSYIVRTAGANSFSLAAGYDLANIALTSSGTGTHTFTPYRLDANPKDVVTAIMGLINFTSGRISDLTVYSNYCLANGLLISPMLEEQRSASDVMRDISDITNSEPVFSERLLKMVPYGDVAATGNGVTYTPNTTPIYDLTDDHFLPGSNEDPVVVLRKAPSDAYNQINIEIKNRANQYNTETIPADDLANIEQFGLRPKSVEQLDMIVEKATALFVAQARLQRALYIKKQYKFKIGAQFSLLEPMDLVTLTDVKLGLNLYPVRITEIAESDDSRFDVLAEDFPLGVASPTLYQNQVVGGYFANYNAASGNANPPVIFTAPGILTATGREIWLAVSGPTLDWGGCEVWVSTDDATYKQAGTIFGRARHGVSTNLWAAGSDPDVNTLSVDLSLAIGELISGAQADANNATTLCLVDHELIAHSTATLTAANKYDLTTYLRRGMFNSSIVSHAIGSRFVRLDQAMFHYPIDSTFDGTTLYFKFPSFNVYGGGRQSVADVSSYSYVVEPSLSYPANVASLGISQNGNVVIFQWPLIEEPNIAGYEIRLVPQNQLNPTSDTVWASSSEVTRVTRGTQITTAKVPPGAWTFLIRARDSSDNYSRLSLARNFTVTSDFNIVSSVSQAPTWPGTLSNFLVHYTGVLVPESTLAANAHTNVELFEQYVPYPQAVCSYESLEIDIGQDGDVRIWASADGAFRSDVAGQFLPVVEVDYHTAAGAYDGYQPWTIGQVSARFVKYKFTINTSDGRSFVRDFVNVVDTVEREEIVSGITIGAGGQAITFQIPFFNVPTVYFDNDSATVLIATSTGVTETGFTGHLYNTSGTQVGGTGKYRAIGV